MNESTQNAPSLRAGAVKLVRRLQNAGFTAYWAGGCVRDVLLGQEPKDYDIATNATPDQVMPLFPGALAVGKAFGVVKAPLNNHDYDVATFRRDAAYSDGRHPDTVSFTDAATDAQRRDFTINALFYDPVTEQTHDFVGGRKDLERRTIRAVGDPDARFNEDHLRMLRAVRFAGALRFTLEPQTAKAIGKSGSRLAGISPARIREEFTRILLEARPAGDALLLMDELGLLAVMLPEVAAMKRQAQPPAFHPEGDVLTHTVIMLNAMKTDDPRLAYAVLLHDVGKPPTAALDGERIRFDGHAAAGATMARLILERLHFSSDDTGAICHCIANHMRFMEVQNMRMHTLRKLMGGPTFPIELELHRLDCLASHSNMDNYRFLLDQQARLADEPVLPQPWITGNDIMALGISQGPQVGVWRKKAYDAQLERTYADRGTLLEWLRGEIESCRGLEDEQPGHE